MMEPKVRAALPAQKPKKNERRSVLARNEILEHLQDTYGTCDRDKPGRNDCYWGKDAAGQYNGCLKVGWLGRNCEHWHPVNGEDLDKLLSVHLG
jgi:hypothetical protein